MANWYSIQASADTATVNLFGDLVDADEFAGEVGAKSFIEDLNAITAPRVVLNINSPGGSVFGGIAVYNAIQAHPAHFTARIQGLSASIATVVMLAADTVEAAQDAMVMVHKSWTLAAGNADDLQDRIDVLNKIDNQMATIYERHTGQPRETIDAWMKSETWFTAQEALEAGLVHSVTEPLQIAASMDYSRFDNDPMEARMAKPNEPGNDRQQLKDELRAELMREEDNRQREINGMYWGEEFAHIRDEALADRNCSADTARERLRGAMAVMSDGPVGSGHVSQHDFVGNYSAGRRAAGRGFDSEYKRAATETLMMRGGLQVKDPHPACQDMQRDSLSDIAAACLNRFGQDASRMNKDQLFRAALSTSDFPQILSNTANKSIGQGYSEAQAVHTAITATREVQDFKVNTIVRMSAFEPLQELGEHSELKHGDLLEAAETFKIDTFGRMLNISRQALVSDDLSLFTSIPSEMGAAARRMESSLYFDMLTSNPTMQDGEQFFSAAHANVGTPAALSTTSLAEAKRLLRMQQSLGGRSYLNLSPAHLLVPPSLEQTALELINSTLLPTVNTNTQDWVASLNLLVSAELEAVSSKAWYVFADPSQLAATAMGFLAGHRVPSIEASEEFERLASSWRVYFDLAAIALEPKAAVFNAGA